MNVEAKLQELVSAFSGVNWNNPGSWPIVVKGSVYLAGFALVMGATFMLFITELDKKITIEKKKEIALLGDYEEKAFKALNLDAYKKQLADMEETFGTLRRQLPKDTEVPSLLEDITHTGLGSGLEFSTIDLGKETRKAFYVELPISIVVRGDYHSLGAFVSGVAALQRIVTLHDFKIKSSGASGKRSGDKKGSQRDSRLLEMSITAKTYRYSDAADQAEK